mgnify:CR=1 FL=1
MIELDKDLYIALSGPHHTIDDKSRSEISSIMSKFESSKLLSDVTGGDETELVYSVRVPKKCEDCQLEFFEMLSLVFDERSEYEPHFTQVLDT